MALDDRSGRIDHERPMLVWAQVAEDLAGMIESGELSRGAKLPTEVELSHVYGVARVTVRRAVGDLAERGLVIRIHGRGTFVAE